MTTQRRLWTPAIVAGVLMAVCFMRAISWQWVNQHSATLRLTPRGEHLLAALALSSPIIPAFALLASAITGRLKTRLTVVLVLLVVLGGAGGFAAVFAWAPFFDGHYGQSTTSPDGTHEAHLWSRGLLGCRGSIYVAARHGLWGALATEREVDCDTMKVRWLEDGGVEVAGDDARPFPLFFGPH